MWRKFARPWSTFTCREARAFMGTALLQDAHTGLSQGE